MTIDEFVRDIAPKMRDGWVAMDASGHWYWHSERPVRRGFNMWGHPSAGMADMTCLSCGFDIAPVDDWAQSLRKVGK